LLRRGVVALAAGIFLLLGGTPQASASGTSKVPIPTVSAPAGTPPLNRRAWLRLWRESPGPTTPRCTSVAGKPGARSGQFVAGNFQQFVADWDGTYETSKLAYTPLYPHRLLPLRVIATQLRGGTQRLEFSFPQIAWSGKGAPFYNTGTQLPTAGTWRLEASTPGDSGCFVVTVGRRLDTRTS
jgi:hypothetical protein